mmetsp:Transcript_33708/g.56614  ORF Transcript_33708/g.56614 Transcript_33708/m.56614 type:complete len:494 (+) Transcript_33708:480-1961(+)
MHLLGFADLAGDRAHGDQLLRSCRVDANAVVELRLRGAHLHCHRNPLQDLSCVSPDDVHPHHLVGGHVHNHLHEHLSLVTRDGVLHGAEGRCVHIDVPALLLCLVFRQPHRPDLWLREHCASHVGVVGGGLDTAEERLRERHALHQRHRGQVDAVRDVSDGPNVVHRCLRELVHLNGSASMHLHPDGLQAEVLHVRLAPRRKHHLLRLNHAAAVHQLEPVRRFLHCGGGGAWVHVDALLLQLLRQELAHFCVETAQGQVLPVDHMHLGAHLVEDASELEGDVAGADDDNLLGEVGEVQGLVGGDHQLLAGKVGHERPPAGGDEDVLGGEALAVDVNGVLVHDAAAPSHHLHIGVPEDLPVDAREAVQLVVLVRDQRLPVEHGRLGDRPAKLLAILEVLCVMGRVHQQLLWHTSADDAGTADSAQGFCCNGRKRHLTNRNLGAIRGGHPRGAHTATAGSDAEQIVVVLFSRGLHRERADSRVNPMRSNLLASLR